MTKIWAHRGASAYAPENTMPAFVLAAEMGADGIEIDIHLTADGELVICHDEFLERVSNGAGFVFEKTLDELKTLDFSKGKPGFENVRISTLKEFYIFAGKHNMFVNTELKYSGDRWDETNEKAVFTAKECGMADRVIYSSFKFGPLLKIKEIEPDAKIGLLYKDGLDDPCWYAKSIGADALHPWFPLVCQQNLYEKCPENGLLLHPWTVNSPDDIRRMMELGVDAVITNHPDYAAQIREERLKGR